MRHLKAPFALGFVGFLVTALVACSDDTGRPAASSGTSSGGAGASSGGGGGGGGGSRDAATDADAAPVDASDLCASPAQAMTEPVSELRILGSAPEPLGGALLPGTYVLAEANAYGAASDGGENGGGTTGISLRQTLVVSEGTLRFFGARGALPLGSDAVSGLTYAVDGTALVATPVCPTAGAVRRIPFSAVGASLALFTDATHRELYVPQ